MSDARRDAASAFRAAQYPRLVGGLTLCLGDHAVAEELAQEAMLRAFRRWEHVDDLDAPAAWLWRVAVNLANSHLRRRGAERRAQARLAADREHQQAGDDLAWGLAVRRAIAQLPAMQRSAVTLRYYLDLSVEDAARRMEVSADAVRSLTKRGVASLREEFLTDASSREVDDA